MMSGSAWEHTNHRTLATPTTWSTFVMTSSTTSAEPGSMAPSPVALLDQVHVALELVLGQQ